MGKHIPLAVILVYRLGINRHHNRLRTKKRRRFAHQIGMAYRHRVDAHFVRARVEQAANIRHAAHAAAHRERDKHAAGNIFNHI